MANYLITESEITALENKIKEVAGISGKLEYPLGFVEAINNLSILPVVSLYDLIGNAEWNGIIDDNTVSTIASYAFYYNYRLASINFNNCIIVNNYAFFLCLKLISASFPKCEVIYSAAFNRCEKLSNIYCPSVKIISNNAFENCYSLSTINLPNCSLIYSYAFANCSKLESLYLLSTSVINYLGALAFYATPILQSSYLGYFGSIFVPTSLLTAYLNDALWSYYSSRFVGVE